MLEGRDRLDLVHRMSTNDVKTLKDGELRSTVFTSPIGRVIDMVQVYAASDCAWLIGDAGRIAALQSYLARHIFFQDDVQLAQASQTWQLLGLYGPQAETTLTETFRDLELPPAGRAVAFEGGLAWRKDQPLAGIQLLLDSEGQVRAEDAWGRHFRLTAVLQAYEIRRVEAGEPAFGPEITPERIPLEVGLWPAVSFTKGCYTGQEVIARMESRGRQARMLVKVMLPGPAQAGQDLQLEARKVGTLTSVVESPSEGWVGLALVRPEALETESASIQLSDSSQPVHLISLAHAQAA
jgi:aminomethyltransferase